MPRNEEVTSVEFIGLVVADAAESKGHDNSHVWSTDLITDFSRFS